jgi:hypothetical protein
MKLRIIDPTGLLIGDVWLWLVDNIGLPGRRVALRLIDASVRVEHVS